MKKLLSVSIIALALFCCSTPKAGQTKVDSFSFDTTKVASGKVFYQCPMHPEVLSERAGTCPKCGMALEKVIKH